MQYNAFIEIKVAANDSGLTRTVEYAIRSAVFSEDGPLLDQCKQAMHSSLEFAVWLKNKELLSAVIVTACYQDEFGYYKTIV